ncbi:response regulator transcription factor [Streptomyces sp. MRC013]|uniref:response regulator transcription factor n=1 Tax=Streptomyces sp. MRC013 TaxID=2898276 RepID=UPI0020276559|nr:response regulator transcription factor [Streptomyces sp. MRC013]URM89880.1 response regulator transcription factor [Streptomyces sp. MRC013]
MIRVLVAEDMHLLREALVSALRLEEDIEVVGELERGDQIIDRAGETVPDVALIDIDLPGLDGISAATRLKETLPCCRILIVTGLARPGNIRRAVEAGVAGFLLKDTPLDQLVFAIQRVARGERVIDVELAAVAMKTSASPFTRREAEVLRLAAEGAPAREIADRLCLELSTVRNYLSTVVTKSGARNRVDAIRISMAEGWI